jgi:hypothetical protein
MPKNYKQEERHIRKAIRGGKVLGIRTTNMRSKGQKWKGKKGRDELIDKNM